MMKALNGELNRPCCRGPDRSGRTLPRLVSSAPTTAGVAAIVSEFQQPTALIPPHYRPNRTKRAQVGVRVVPPG